MVQLVCVHGGINSPHKIESLSRPHGSFLVKPVRISENCHNPSYQVNQETLLFIPIPFFLTATFIPIPFGLTTTLFF